MKKFPFNHKKSRSKSKSVLNRSDRLAAKNNSTSKLFTVLLSVATFFAVSILIIGGYVLTHIISFTNGEKAIDLEDYKDNQNQTSIVYYYDKDNKPVEMTRLHGEENRIWVSLDKMPKMLLKAFISLEDKRFYDHKGVDWIRTTGVIVKYNFSQGGSTITQQLIKNLTEEKDVTFVRKFNEILLALNLEKNYEKTDILEAYLNTLYLGEGCYGVKTAAEVYFGKDVADLNLAECATLASITKAPYAYDPLVNPEDNKVRQEHCLSEMYNQGVISKEVYDEAVNYKLIFTNSDEYVKPAEDKEKPKQEVKEEIQSYYVDFVIDQVIKDLVTKYGYDRAQAWRMVYYGGLRIYSAVDITVQQAMEDVYYNRKTFPDESSLDEKDKAQSAMTVMDYSGRVVGIIGGAGQKSGNRELNRASDSPRQPGSSIKPLSVYAPALEEDYIHWSSPVLDAPIANKGSLWPQNFGGNKGSNSNVTVQYAIAKSLNTVPARLVQTMSVQKSFDYLKDKFHISTLVSEGPKSDIDYSPMAVGGMNTGITSLDMTAAYAVFGNGGKYYKPYCYYEVTNSKGEKLLENTGTYEQVLSADTSDVMCELLQTVTTSSYGTATAYRIGKFQTMAKTGTTTDDKDRWFCGGTPYYVSAVWYGYDTPKKITNAYGNPAGKLFKAVMDKVHSGLEDKTFEKSELTVKRSFCTVSKQLATDQCLSTGTGWYKVTSLPGKCSTCQAGASTTSESKGTTTTTTPAATTTTKATTTAATTTTKVVVD